MITTKDQERQALKKIKKIIDGLGEESFIGKAFEGCCELAEQNIEYDFWCSYKEQAHIAEDKVKALSREVAELKEKLTKSQEELEKEQEWVDYEDKENVSQGDYQKLKESFDTRVMDDHEAKKLLNEWFGFEWDKIKIVHTVPVCQINRHRHVRRIGDAERLPLYNATDFNYIRFDCGMMQYELCDGDLRFFVA